MKLNSNYARRDNSESFSRAPVFIHESPLSQIRNYQEPMHSSSTSSSYPTTSSIGYLGHQRFEENSEPFPVYIPKQVGSGKPRSPTRLEKLLEKIGTIPEAGFVQSTTSPAQVISKATR